MIENELYVVKENKFDNPLLTETDSIIDSCFKDCQNNYFHKFKYKCIYDIKLSSITKKETIKMKLIGKSMILCKLNKDKNVRQNCFIFNQINNLTKKFYSHLRYINVSSYLKFQILMCHRQFFRKNSQNREFIKNFCNDVENPFNFACQDWFNQIN